MLMRLLLKFLKDWILPVAMITGALTYRWIGRLSFLTPYLLFAMLLLTFCKISFKEIRFHPAHLWLLLIQLAGSIGLYYLLLPFNGVIAQGAMLCVIVPTATAAVITGMLGGNVGFLARVADEGGYVEGEKICGFDERPDRGQVDVIGIDEIFAREAQRRHRGVRFAAHVRRVRMNVNVLAVRLVPHRSDVQSGFLGLHDGAQLRLALMRETVADAKGIFFQFHDVSFAK